MGKTNQYIIPWYKKHIQTLGDVGLLGFSNNNLFEGDLYDLSIKNWDINNAWTLKQKYDTLICTRCAYFSKDPSYFISRCWDHLNDGGKLYVDWGLGDHWRFSDYKIGWKKNGEQEYAYKKNNFLWSTVWDEELLTDSEFKLFSERVSKFGYKNLKNAILEEVPHIITFDEIKKFFKISYNTISLWEDLPQFYILLSLTKLNN